MANDALGRLQAKLNEYGLGSLIGWANDLLVQGLGEAEVEQRLYERPEFQVRFAPIFERRKRGLPAISPREILENERTYAQIMRNAGLPSGFYDQPEDFQRLLTEDVSPLELKSRVDEGFGRVLTAAPEVRSAFKDYFGVAGDQALAAFFLDPDRATPLLMQKASQAMVGGRARQAGLDLSAAGAERLIAGVGEAQGLEAVSRAQRQSALATETASETTDLTGEQAILGASGVDEAARQALLRRSQSREAQMQGGGQQAATQEGVIGAGTARRY